MDRRRCEWSAERPCPFVPELADNEFVSHEGRQFCALHAPLAAKSHMDLHWFHQTFRRLQDKQFLDFSGVEFPGQMGYDVVRPIQLQGCTFGDGARVSIQTGGCNLSGSTFLGRSDIRNDAHNATLNLSGCRFCGDLTLDNEAVEATLDLSRSTFHAESRFRSQNHPLRRLVFADCKFVAAPVLRSFLLVDLEFGNSDWWRGACSALAQQTRLPSWRGSFPRASGAQLARITLLLAWNSLRAARDLATARLLLGMTDEVGQLIANLKFDQIDRIAQKRSRFVRPRWDDRPAIWRRLLLAARTEDTRLMGEFNVHALQLLSGDLLGLTAPPG